MTALDLKRELQYLYKPSAKQPEIVDVPPFHFLMIDGSGDPNTAQAYRDAVEALYSAAYTLKFAVKKARGIQYPVMALEGLWWSDDMRDFLAGNRDRWQWTMMILQPDVVTDDDFAGARDDLHKKKDLPALDRMRLAPYHEGLSAQIMHVGPYAAEAPTIERLHRFIAEQGCAISGKHHEIYLGDPRRSAPEKLKTIIRQPMRRLP